MALLDIILEGDPRLRQKSTKIRNVDAGLRKLAADMRDTMLAAPGVGLAAPQVGRPIRLVVFDIGEEDGARALANPVLRDEWGEQIAEEGCLSLPGLYYPVKRAMKLWAEGQDLQGKMVTIEAEEMLARVLQHEVDHLNGVLFIDRLEAEHRSQAMAELRDQALGLSPAVQDPARAL